MFDLLNCGVQVFRIYYGHLGLPIRASGMDKFSAVTHSGLAGTRPALLSGTENAGKYYI